MPLKRIVILSPKSMSVSAKNLSMGLQETAKLPSIVVNPHSTTYQGRKTDYVINWGVSKEPDFLFNDAGTCYAIASAVNKLSTFKVLSYYEIPTLEYTTDSDLALEWYKTNTVIARTTLNGFGGQGIHVIEPEEALIEAPLYTKYKKKKHEYRVHIAFGKVIDITQKKKQKGATVNSKIRNHKNGWVYCRLNIDFPEELKDIAIKAIRALALDFGAVDIIWNQKEDKYYVLEVNTAPGLVGTTLTAYINAFTQDIKSWQ